MSEERLVPKKALDKAIREGFEDFSRESISLRAINDHRLSGREGKASDMPTEYNQWVEPRLLNSPRR